MKSCISNFAPAFFAFTCVALVVFDVVIKGSPISFASTLLMIVATLPWASQIIDTFSFSEKGISAKLKTVDALLDRETESSEESPAFQIDSKSNKYKILKSLMNGAYSMRSVSGIRKELELPTIEVRALLHDLRDDGLALQVDGKSGPRWIISSSGMNVMQLPSDPRGLRMHQETSDD